MEFVLINTAEKKFLELFKINMQRGAAVLDHKYTDSKQKACLLMDAESAVFMAGFLNWIVGAQVFFAVPCEDDNAIFVLLNN